jgi:multidrug transporter EmrE-like cation transporter
VFNMLCLAAFTTLLAIGQLLFKKVGLIMRGQPFFDGVLAVLASPTLYLALGLYGIATALWIWILSRVSLSLAYPWVGVGVILVPLLAYFVYGERVNAMYWVGATLVTAGIILTQLGTSGP